MYASSDEEEDDEEFSASECTSSSSEESSELTTTSEDEDDEDSEPSSSSENEDEAEDSGEFDSSSPSSSSSSSYSSASSFSSDSTADSAEERPALLIHQHPSKHKGGLLPRIKLSATGGGIPAGDGGGGGGGGGPGEARRYSSPDLASVARGLRSSPPLSEEQRDTSNRRGSAHSAREGARLAVETENSLLDENSKSTGRTKRFSFSISRMRSDTPPKQRSGSFTLINQKHKKKKMHKSKQVMNEDDVKEKAAEGEEPGADKLPELQMETVIQGYMENEKKNKKRTKKERKKKKVKQKTTEKTKQKKKTGEQERHSRGSEITDTSLHCSNDSLTNKASKDGLRSLLVTPRKGLLKKKGKTRSNNSSNNVERKRKKGAPSFCLYKVQQLGSEQWHKGAIWALKFNADGSYMASGGNDCIVRVWKVEPHEGSQGRLSQYVQPSCVRTFVGHEADILDISWSNNDFLLSASMDNTVRLWHTSCEECVSCFNHQDFVTSVSFHPLNNKTFISGGLDGKLSLWNIARKIVISQAELPCMVTAACFTKPRGHQVIVGTESGKLLVYSTKDALAAASPRRNEEMRELELVREVSVNSRRGHGKKITGIQVSHDGRYVLVTANDALIRLYNSKDYSLVRTFAGCVSKEFQISAAFSNDEKYIISGSEDRHSFLWENTDPFNKKSCNTAYESFRVHEQMAPVAIFAPPVEGLAGEVIVTAGLDGSIAFLHGVPSRPADH